ncbi:MAG: hypothetical protein KTR32_27895 [Granulosicoccus sp.]|nr:hypothetical protein [Granulosicoccus sp.]
MRVNNSIVHNSRPLSEQESPYQNTADASARAATTDPLLWSLSSPTERQQLIAEQQLKDLVTDKLRPLAQDATAFQALIDDSFGTNTNKDAVSSLRLAFLENNFQSLPRIHLVDSSELQGALGAYSQDTIFLDRELAGTKIGEQTLLEELGHAIDARINDSDSAGDEGEIFRRTVSGERIDSATLSRIRSEDDQGTLTINGRNIDVEFRDGRSLPASIRQIEARAQAETSSTSGEYVYTGPGSVSADRPIDLPAPKTDFEYTGPGSPAAGGMQDTLPDTSGLTEEERVRTYENILTANASDEAIVAYNNNETVVLALRHESPLFENRGSGDFDDRFVVLWTDENGDRRSREFEGSLDPNLRYGDDLREDISVDKPPASMGQYGDITTDSSLNPWDEDQIHVWGRVAGGQTILMQTGPKDQRLYPPADGGYALDVDTNGNGIFDDSDSIVRDDNAFQLHGPARDDDGNITHTGSGGCMTVKDEDAFFDLLQDSNLSTVETSNRSDFLLPESLEQDGTESTVFLTIV